MMNCVSGVRSTTSGQKIGVRLVKPNSAKSSTVDIFPVANAWTEVTIPLRDFGNISRAVGIIWQEQSGSPQPTMYLDNISLRGAGSSTPTAANVYDNGLGTGWRNGSWNTDVDFAQNNVVYRGDASIAARYRGAWSGLALRTQAPVDLNPYAELHFWVRSTTPRQKIGIWLVKPNSSKSSTVRIFPIANEWAEVTIPLRRFWEYLRGHRYHLARAQWLIATDNVSG